MYSVVGTKLPFIHVTAFDTQYDNNPLSSHIYTHLIQVFLHLRNSLFLLLLRFAIQF